MGSRLRDEMTRNVPCGQSGILDTPSNYFNCIGRCGTHRFGSLFFMEDRPPRSESRWSCILLHFKQVQIPVAFLSRNSS
jgi:hypothetical protein